MVRTGKKRDILGKVVLATIEGDIHDIGKTLVGTMMSASGFEVFDMGVDVPIMKIVEKAREVGADIVGVSALLTTTMAKQKDVIEALEDSGMESVKVMVGGAPVDQSFADEVGADGYAPDASTATILAKSLFN